MKYGDFYQHYKNVEYRFVGIALPLQSSMVSGYIKNSMIIESPTRYHEDTHDIDLYAIGGGGVMFIDSVVPHVIYQSEKDYDTERVYAREVDDFFGMIDVDGEYKKRFTLKKK